MGQSRHNQEPVGHRLGLGRLLCLHLRGHARGGEETPDVGPGGGRGWQQEQWEHGGRGIAACKESRRDGKWGGRQVDRGLGGGRTEGGRRGGVKKYIGKADEGGNGRRNREGGKNGAKAFGQREVIRPPRVHSKNASEDQGVSPSMFMPSFLFIYVCLAVPPLSFIF